MHAKTKQFTGTVHKEFQLHALANAFVEKHPFCFPNGFSQNLLKGWLLWKNFNSDEIIFQLLNCLSHPRKNLAELANLIK